MPPGSEPAKMTDLRVTQVTERGILCGYHFPGAELRVVSPGCEDGIAVCVPSELFTPLRLTKSAGQGAWSAAEAVRDAGPR